MKGRDNLRMFGFKGRWNVERGWEVGWGVLKRERFLVEWGGKEDILGG